MQNGKKSGNPLYIYENSGIIKEYPSSEGGRIFMYDKIMTFSVNDEKEIEMKKTLMLVYDALTKKGYNPVNQIVGYILSEDPTSYRSGRTVTGSGKVLSAPVSCPLNNSKKTAPQVCVQAESGAVFLYVALENVNIVFHKSA